MIAHQALGKSTSAPDDDFLTINNTTMTIAIATMRIPKTRPAIVAARTLELEGELKR